jgi:YfiH family protein
MVETVLIYPDWPAPARVKAVSSTRLGGFSQPPWEGLNLGDHVGDDPSAVTANRQQLIQSSGMPGSPCWLQQVHGDRLVSASRQICEADASITGEPGKVCVVMTADCLPLLMCNLQGNQVAAVHAGWRGLAAGVIEKTLDGFDCPPRDILVWLGPAIGPSAFEVGSEVRQAFIQQDKQAARAFKPSRKDHWLADIYLLARLKLSRKGVRQVFGGNYCTYSDAQQFFSYRRDGQTGRMASLIWLQQEGKGEMNDE